MPATPRNDPACRAAPLVQYRNCTLLRDHAFVVDDLWVRAGRILNPERLFFDEKVRADVVVDCGGRIIAPGFIDLQINGAFGVDFSVNNDSLSTDIDRVAAGLLAHGVTSFCPTIVTSHPDIYKSQRVCEFQILRQFHRTEGSRCGAGVLGLHLEGPFISKEKKGAHTLECIADMSHGIGDLERVYGSLADVSIVTLAPELPGAIDVIEQLTARGITASLGHSMANLAQGEEAVRAGARFITHLFNAMLPFHHRDPHLVGLLASPALPADRAVFYGMITDGIHTHPAALRIAHRTHPAGMVVVTDAVPAMGLPPGTHHLGAQVVEVQNGRAVIAGTETLAGSIATMNQCVQFFLEATGCSVVEALEAASLHPAQLLGISLRKGTLDFGSDADFLVLDERLNVLATFVGGERAWIKEGVTLEGTVIDHC